MTRMPFIVVLILAMLAWIGLNGGHNPPIGW
jgi:hypothetical protein